MDDKTFVRAAFSRAEQESERKRCCRRLLVEKTVQHRQLIENDLPLFPGVVTFSESRRARHFDLGLVSMANNAEIDYVLDLAQLRTLFSVIVSRRRCQRLQAGAGLLPERL